MKKHYNSCSTKTELIVLAIVCIVTVNAFEGNAESPPKLNNGENGTLPKEKGIVGAFVFPHGGITVDPETRDYSKESASVPTTKEESLKLNKAMKEAARELVSRKPEIIIMATPHGLLLQNHFLFVGNRYAEGSFENQKYLESFDLDYQSVNTLYNSLENMSNPVEVITLGVGYDTMPLRWAEIIPWKFIKEAADNVNFTLPPVVLVGVPSSASLSSLLKFGNDISSIIETDNAFSQKRMAIVISCDLSHYHSNALSSPYPYSKSSSIFDNYCVQWGKLDRNNETEEQSTEILIKNAGEVATSAGSCGYKGLVILHGILSKAVKNGGSFKAHFFQYSAPSYFGMMVTSFLPS